MSFKRSHPYPPKQPDGPTKTLFVRNIAFEVSQSELRELFALYGPVNHIFEQIDKRGIAFVTYVSCCLFVYC